MRIIIATVTIAAFAVAIFSNSIALCGGIFLIMGACGTVFVFYSGLKMLVFIFEEKLKIEDPFIFACVAIIAILCVVAAAAMV